MFIPYWHCLKWDKKKRCLELWQRFVLSKESVSISPHCIFPLSLWQLASAKYKSSYCSMHMMLHGWQYPLGYHGCRTSGLKTEKTHLLQCYTMSWHHLNQTFSLLKKIDFFVCWLTICEGSKGEACQYFTPHMECMSCFYCIKGE